MRIRFRSRPVIGAGLALLLVALPVAANDLWYYEKVTAAVTSASKVFTDNTSEGSDAEFRACTITLENAGSVRVHFVLSTETPSGGTISATAVTTDPSMKESPSSRTIVWDKPGPGPSCWTGIAYRSASSTAEFYIDAR